MLFVSSPASSRIRRVAIRLEFWFSSDGRHTGFFETLMHFRFVFSPSSFLEEKLGPWIGSWVSCFLFPDCEYVSSKTIHWRTSDYLLRWRQSPPRLPLYPWPTVVWSLTLFVVHRMRNVVRFIIAFMLGSSAELRSIPKDKSRIRCAVEKWFVECYRLSLEVLRVQNLDLCCS
jgi:hypothetical protein